MAAITLDKVRGMIIGGAIGDALGMPVESWNPERIFQIFPRGMDRYYAPHQHKYFNADTMPPGTWTDDTHLTIATAEAMMESGKGPDAFMRASAGRHSKAMDESTAGWGKTTKEAIERIKQGCSWKESGKTDEPRRGTGNGVPMKCAPLALALKGRNGCLPSAALRVLVDYSAMTHYTVLSAEACFVHVFACHYCLTHDHDFSLHDFLKLPLVTLTRARKGLFDTSKLVGCIDDLDKPFRDLLRWYYRGSLPVLGVEFFRSAFGNGSYYVFDSLPFAYAFFAQNPFSLASVSKVAAAGGDTDTNAKMVGEMVGALMGYNYFLRPENRWTLDGLQRKDELLDLADRLYKAFRSKKGPLF